MLTCGNIELIGDPSIFVHGIREVKHDVYFPANGKNSTSVVCRLAFVRRNE